jgi:hypothetical protein
VSRSAIGYLGVFALAVVYWLPIAGTGLNVYDEGLRLYGAQRILAGDLPYRDVFTYYGPAQFYWPALLFRLFGTQVLVARVGNLFFGAVAAAALFALCRSAALPVRWSLMPVVALLVPLYRGDLLYACDPAFSLVLAAGAVLTGTSAPTRGLVPRGCLRCLAAGLLVGLAALFRQDVGAYGAVAAVVIQVGIAVSRPGRRQRWVGLAAVARSLGCLALGIALVVGPVYGLLAAGGVWRVLEALVVFPATSLAYRDLPYSYELRRLYWSLRAMESIGPPAVVQAVRAGVLLTPFVGLGAVLSLALPLVRRATLEMEGRARVLLFVLTLALGLSMYALGRSDFYHVYPLHVLCVCATSLILASVLERRAGSWEARLLSASLSVLIGVALVGMSVAQRSAVAGYAPLGLARATGIVVPEQLAGLSRAVADIDAKDSDPRILVASMRHDRVHDNAVILYFLSGRASGTYFHDFIPGLTTTQAVQERIVAELRRNNVRTIVVWKGVLPEEPNLSAVSSHVFVLDDFLRSEFVPVRDTDDYRILVRRP